MNPLIKEVENAYRSKTPLSFHVGDTVDVHVKIREGDKERVQVFSGTVLARKHDGLRETFTVRRLVQGEGVERIFPVNSPNVVKVEVQKSGRVRRAKLYYLRERTGRQAQVGVLREEEEKGEPVGEEVEESGSPEVKEEKVEKSGSPGVQAKESAEQKS